MGAPCYHMHEVFEHLDHVPAWQRAVEGTSPDWATPLAGYGAAVDWPASAFWQELAAANPEAVIVLSVRDSAATWWRSADATILGVARRAEQQPPELQAWVELFLALLRERIGERWDDPKTAMAAYERHNAYVRRQASSDRLVEWRPEEGWQPLCQALDVPVPDEPFPHVNTTADWHRD